MHAADYHEIETLRDGLEVTIRALKPADEAGLLAAIGRTSEASLYKRFFGVKRTFSAKEVAFFVHVDFVDHVALVAEIGTPEGSVIVGGARYVMTKPGSAEAAFVVTDAYQGRGLGTVLCRHLIEIGREAGLKELVADVLPGNSAMLTVFARTGLSMITRRSMGNVHIALSL